MCKNKKEEKKMTAYDALSFAIETLVYDSLDYLDTFGQTDEKTEKVISVLAKLRDSISDVDS